MEKWYKVEFYAKMTDDDIKAMQSCFYAAMNEAMGIPECEGLKITEEVDEDAIADIVLSEDDYILDARTGQIKIDKQVFDDFVKNTYINIKFVDEEHQPLNQYIMVDEDDEYIYCDFLDALN